MPQVLTHDVWMYRDPTLATSLSKQELVGYKVESIDGSIGKIDDASFETDTGYIVVDTGPGSSAEGHAAGGRDSERRPREREGLRQSDEG